MTGDHMYAVRVSPGCIIPVTVRANPHTMTAQPTLEVDSHGPAGDRASESSHDDDPTNPKG